MQLLEEGLVTQYVLHKHHLLESSQTESILQVVNDIIALHATSAGTPYLSLFARMKNFQRKCLDEEFYVKRNLIRLQAMRGTLFITSIQLAPLLYQATKLPEVMLLKRLHKWGISLSEYHELAEKLYSILEDGEKTLPELKKALPKEMIRSVELKAGKECYKGTNINIVLSSMLRKGIVISEKGPETLRITKA
ncbi:MAG: DNA glycosylase AlkZ-like family protein, partial [Candidatus Bathycorpusculaceae bacterium]